MPMAMLLGSRTTWRPSLPISATIRRLFARRPRSRRILWGIARGPRRRRLGEVTPARVFDDGDERVLHRGCTPGPCLGTAAHFGRGSLREDLAGVHDGDPVAVFGLLQEVRGDDDR